MRPRKRSRKPKRSGIARRCTILSLLGLLVSTIGASGVIALRPQIEVTPGVAVESGQPFSAPLRVENTGYFSFRIERVFFCVRHVRIGGLKMGNAVLSDDRWGNRLLDGGKGESISTHFLQSIRPPDEADIVLAIDGRPWKSFPHVDRRYFRFTRFDGPYYGIWTWLEQPSEDVKADVDEQIERWEKTNQK